MRNTLKKILAMTVCVMMIVPVLASCKMGKAITEEAGDFDAVTSIDKKLERTVAYTGDPIVHVETVITHVTKTVYDDSGSGGSGSGSNSGKDKNDGTDPKPTDPTDPNGGDGNNGDGNNGDEKKVDKTGTPLKILTQNLMVGSMAGAVPDQGIQWRQYRFKALVDQYDPDVIGLQEANYVWVPCLEQLLTETYNMEYKYRWESNKEATPVLYKKDKFTRMNGGYFWLSDTPNVESNSYGETAAPARICSWVFLKDKASGKTFYFYSTHFGLGTDPSIKAGQQIANTLAALPKNTYAFCVGDFNLSRNSSGYRTIFNEFEKWVDIWEVALSMQDFGWDVDVFINGGTMNGNFDYDNYGGEKGGTAWIDYVTAKPHKNLGINYIRAIYDLWGDDEHQVPEGFISDHFGVICEVRLGSKIDYSKEDGEFYLINY